VRRVVVWGERESSSSSELGRMHAANPETAASVVSPKIAALEVEGGIPNSPLAADGPEAGFANKLLPRPGAFDEPNPFVAKAVGPKQELALLAIDPLPNKPPPTAAVDGLLGEIEKGLAG
jgi:hypothetical protein